MNTSISPGAGARAREALTLRDYFAARATEKDIAEYLYYKDARGVDRARSREAARYAYADAMLYARADL